MEFHQNKCRHRNALDTSRKYAKDNDQWAQGVVGRTHFAASHVFASWARSPGGGNKESKAWSRWKLGSMASQLRG
jgi:hypothetical protein